jgi:hypothetical protein
MLQLSSLTNALPDIHHHTALSLVEAANVEDVACVLSAASLSSSGATHGIVLVVEERTFSLIVVSPSPSPAQLLRSAASEDSMTHIRNAFLGGKEGKWSSIK